MWAQGWQAIFPIVSEFQAPALDVTEAMKNVRKTKISAPKIRVTHSIHSDSICKEIVSTWQFLLQVLKSTCDLFPWQQNYTVLKMFETSDGFFKGLGLIGLEEGAIAFYKDSMLEKPTDGRNVVCHASAWDFMKTNKSPGDFRLPSIRFWFIWFIGDQEFDIAQLTISFLF